MKVDGGLGMGSTKISDIAREAKSQEERGSVSYTHLTLPTIYSV